MAPPRAAAPARPPSPRLFPPFLCHSLLLPSITLPCHLLCVFYRPVLILAFDTYVYIVALFECTQVWCRYFHRVATAWPARLQWEDPATSVSGQSQRQWADPASVGRFSVSGRIQRQWEDPASVGRSSGSWQIQRQWEDPASVGRSGVSGQSQRPWAEPASVGRASVSGQSQRQWADRLIRHTAHRSGASCIMQLRPKRFEIVPRWCQARRLPTHPASDTCLHYQSDVKEVRLVFSSFQENISPDR